MADKGTLDWKSELLFVGAVDGRELKLDGNRKEACSPMEALMHCLAGCMAIDLVHILGKMRSAPKSLRVQVEGERAETAQPKRFARMKLRFEIGGEGIKPADVERALELSREKYCSVFHSLRQDMELDTSYIIHP